MIISIGANNEWYKSRNPSIARAGHVRYNMPMYVDEDGMSEWKVQARISEMKKSRSCTSSLSHSLASTQLIFVQ
jgi:hypothetical protein